MSNGKSDYDLMELAAEPAKEFKAGQRWVMRNGEVATIEEVNAANNYPVLYTFLPLGYGLQTRTAKMNGRHSDKHESQVDLMWPFGEKHQPAPEQPLDAFLQAARNDLVEQALRFAEIADSVASNHSWESVVKLKMLTAMLQQVIEHEGTL